MAWRPGHPLPAPSLPSPRMKQTTDHTPSHAAPSAPDSLEQLRVQYARDRGRWIGSLLAPTMGRRGVRLVLQHLSDLADRSEEHTSELQSQSNIVCRLL